MYALTARDLAGVREAAHTIADACLGSGTPWREAALAPMSQVMRAELVGHHAITRSAEGWTAEIIPYPASARIDTVPEVLEDHPVVRHYRSHPEDSTTLRLSHFYTDRELRQSALFRLVLQPLGTRRLIVIPAAFTATNGDAFAVARSGRDFSEREESVGDALQSLLSALRHHDARTARAARALTGSGGLTQRERAVLELLARGLTAFSIGRSLAISERTVHKHLQNVYRKLGVNDRLGAVRLLEAGAPHRWHRRHEPPVR